MLSDGKLKVIGHVDDGITEIPQREGNKEINWRVDSSV